MVLIQLSNSPCCRPARKRGTQYAAVYPRHCERSEAIHLAATETWIVHTNIQGSAEHPILPAQWLHGLYRALPGESLLPPPLPSSVSLSGSNPISSPPDL